MVSIESSKRYVLDPIQDQSKKARYSHYYENPCLITLQTSYRSENLSRLKTLFPFKSPEELSKVLDDNFNSFELALSALQAQEKAKYLDAVSTKQAQSIVRDLSLAKNLEEAVRIIKKVLENHEKVEIKEDKEAQVKVLQDHLKTVTNENVILKKAIIKLNESVRDVVEKDKVIERLEKELEFERCRSYALSLQLRQAMSSYDITPNNNIF